MTVPTPPDPDADPDASQDPDAEPGHVLPPPIDDPTLDPEKMPPRIR